MSLILPELCNQYCVYWPPSTPDKFGESAPGTAVEFPCRWLPSSSEITDDKGNKVTLTATVTLYTLETIEPPVALGGWLWFGRLADKPSVPPPKQQIKSITSTPSIENDETNHTVAV